jgi:hypothetical protein
MVHRMTCGARGYFYNVPEKSTLLATSTGTYHMVIAGLQNNYGRVVVSNPTVDPNGAGAVLTLATPVYVGEQYVLRCSG